jgi:thermitase
MRLSSPDSARRVLSRFGVLCAVLLSVLLLLLSASLRADRVILTRPNGTRIFAGEVLIRLRPGTDLTRIAPRLRSFGNIGRSLPRINTYQLRLRPGLSIEEAQAKLQQIGEIMHAEPNQVYTLQATPNDPNWNSGSSPQWGPRKMQVDRAWDFWYPCTPLQQPVVVAVIDTGVDSNHPDLRNVIYRDAQGIVGFDAVNNVRGNANPVNHPHGTHVAGIIAAQTNNGIGIAGVAGWRGKTGFSDTDVVKIMPIQVFYIQNNQLISDDVTVSNAIIWAANHGADVINLSLGSHDPSATMDSAMAYAWSAGVVNVAAAGNSGSTNYFYPAFTPNTISVAASINNASDDIAHWSNRSSRWVTVAAPGDNIYSTYWPGNGYAAASGTSMAAPHVAGLAALILAHNATLTNQQVRDIITSTCDRPNTTYGVQFGRVNAYRALRAAGMVVAGNVTLSGSTHSGQTITFAFRPAGGGSSLLRSVLLPETGSETASFCIPGIPPGTYSLAVRGDRWLQRAVSIDLSSLSASNLNLTLLPGDLNADNIIDLFDLILFFEAYGSQIGAASWNPVADLTTNGIVDLFDLVLFFENYGAIGDP